ncbi:hypothetical protein SAMN05421805_10692 [Saccharopolyspora antimicrobica]|uniref:Uncharacterized protein n=1 Tax=Saccharopolyspora antimicrobica TaxID=455193 RepID=A0A1I5B2E4_9PSEU|nr:hypothetical protein [Saccharopolyspora antimicrobica]RKT86446.1 hypothetical protein ATL45_4820 [Saccharopolyspora antimicrobica]SFN68886.1 hypothetical protein SAMN05421805_10692 [Saccharopolyspora antimicrobica]
MAEQKTGLDYYLDSDAWKDTEVADWDKVDAYVEQGWLTEQDREYLHAYGSMVALSPDSAGGFSETDAAWSKYLEVKEEHEDDPLFNEDAKAEEIPPPDWDDGPQDGKDYHQDTPFKVPGTEETPVGEVPDVPGDNGENKGGEKVIGVNTKALKVFADNVESLRDLIAKAKTKTDDVDIKPGGFNLAYQMRGKIMGAENKAGLKNDVRSYLDELDITLRNVRDEVRKLVVDYDSTEELNKLTAEKLGTIMDDSFKFINSNSKPAAP